MARTLGKAGGVAAVGLGLLAPITSAHATPAQCGKASWYAMTSRTANGERANPNTLTAAHRSLPFGTVVTVVNLDNGKSVKVRINDRGPFVKSRVIDVTRQAAKELGFVNRGVARVKVIGPSGEVAGKSGRC
ncbi:septal ring lytic transglycosylase RlpA family protein [Microvirga tunisiensis]|uniref:Endolytic peptidoglycan transglycosylase RlpA n=2 Tax=Pannonibacter tanglangensis TaxID=2750084 RepID=A0A7X5F5B8_9HYPH|nr:MULTISPECIES: septal ring lytic transglycosylase RlpA family protein [unclassified Pannonibacter]NBN65713.1 septal ring lytic transglycosylase RlpA family protein [Pannonibacter sp. XCT-34]NBN80060.1 septal ring lytic transglycosylase RlpA family protein [Pannonibacter sp. XCT-53]